MTTTYKLNHQETLQALCDFITKKYHIHDMYTANVNVKFETDEDRNALSVTVTVDNQL